MDVGGSFILLLSPRFLNSEGLKQEKKNCSGFSPNCRGYCFAGKEKFYEDTVSSLAEMSYGRGCLKDGIMDERPLQPAAAGSGSGFPGHEKFATLPTFRLVQFQEIPIGRTRHHILDASEKKDKDQGANEERSTEDRIELDSITYSTSSNSNAIARPFVIDWPCDSSSIHTDPTTRRISDHSREAVTSAHSICIVLSTEPAPRSQNGRQPTIKSDTADEPFPVRAGEALSGPARREADRAHGLHRLVRSFRGAHFPRYPREAPFGPVRVAL